MNEEDLFGADECDRCGSARCAGDCDEDEDLGTAKTIPPPADDAEVWPMGGSWS